MGLKRRNVRSVNKKDKDIGGISLSDYQKEAIKIAIANKKGDSFRETFKTLCEI